MDSELQSPSLISPNFDDSLLLDWLDSPYHVDQITTDVLLPVNTCHQGDLHNLPCEGWSDFISFDPVIPEEEQMPQQDQGNTANSEIARQAGQRKCKPSEGNVSSDSESNGKGKSPASNSGKRVKRYLGVQKPKKRVSSCPKENHKILERERRKSMHNLFRTLRSLLPHSTPSKKEQLTVLDETINYIHTAETKLEKLQNKKKFLLVSSTPEAEDSSSTGFSSLSNEEMGLTNKTVNNSSSTTCSSPPNISIKFENGEVNITVSTPNRWGAPLSRILQELTTHGFVLRNCNVFKSGTIFFQHFIGQYPRSVSSPSTEYDIRGRLEKVVTA